MSTFRTRGFRIRMFNRTLLKNFFPEIFQKLKFEFAGHWIMYTIFISEFISIFLLTNSTKNLTIEFIRDFFFSCRFPAENCYLCLPYNNYLHRIYIVFSVICNLEKVSSLQEDLLRLCTNITPFYIKDLSIPLTLVAVRYSGTIPSPPLVTRNDSNDWVLNMSNVQRLAVIGQKYIASQFTFVMIF